jgi:hypothetical protein
MHSLPDLSREIDSGDSSLESRSCNRISREILWLMNGNSSGTQRKWKAQRWKPLPEDTKEKGRKFKIRSAYHSQLHNV